MTIETFNTLPGRPIPAFGFPRGDCATRRSHGRDGCAGRRCDPVGPSTVELFWNGIKVSPDLSRAGDLTTIQYAPPGLLAPGTPGAFQLRFADTGSPPATKSYPFGFVVAHYIGPNGNFYEFVNGSGFTWDEARMAAEQRTYCGRAGHLATVTAAEEDMYLEKLRQECVVGEAWLAAFQLPNQLAPTDGWFWINNEGPIPGQRRWRFRRLDAG